MGVIRDESGTFVQIKNKARKEFALVSLKIHFLSAEDWHEYARSFIIGRHVPALADWYIRLDYDGLDEVTGDQTALCANV